MQSKDEVINAVFSAVGAVYGLTKTQIIKQEKGTKQELSEAHHLVVLLLKERGFSYRNIAAAFNKNSGGQFFNAYQNAFTWLEKNIYKDFSLKYAQITAKMPIVGTYQQLNNLENEPENVFESFEGNEKDVSENTPINTPENVPERNEAATFEEIFEDNAVQEIEVIAPSDSPLATEMLIRDRTDLFPKSTPEKEAIAAGADPSDPFADFDTQPTQIPVDSIPEVQFERVSANANATGTASNAGKVVINEDTAEFTTSTILSLLETVSVEVCHQYSQIDDDKVRQMVEKKEAPKDAVITVQGINKHNHDKLQNTASTHLKNVAESLKRVVINKNIQTSPETALVLMLLVFAGMMYMATIEIKKNSIDAIERLREIHTANTK